MKPYHPVVLLVGLLITGLGIYFATGALADHYLSSKPSSDAGIICTDWHPTYVVKIKQGVVNPRHVNGRICDKLQIINQDDVLREMAFGEHEHHQAYDGIYEQNLTKGQSFTITMNKTGTYRFHDHFQDSVNGTFTVTN
jgi:hypothetical protein